MDRTAILLILRGIGILMKMRMGDDMRVEADQWAAHVSEWAGYK